MAEIILPTKAQVNEILASLGKIGDAANQNGTAQAKLRHIVNTLNTVNTNVNSVNSNVFTVNNNVGSNSDGANANGSVHAKLKDVKNNLSSVGIKGVQRGSVSFSVSQYVQISTVNPQKAFTIAGCTYGPAAANLTSNRLDLYIPSSAGNASVYWQVIEFY